MAKTLSTLYSTKRAKEKYYLFISNFPVMHLCCPFFSFLMRGELLYAKVLTH